MLIFLIAASALAAFASAVLSQPRFGKAPQGKRLEKMKLSPHYKDGKFHNLMPTPQFKEGTTMLQVMYRLLFGKTERKKPEKPFTFTKTNIKQIPPDENALVWMGHSSYYLQVHGRKLLADPVFAGHASPFSFMTRAFAGTDLYTAADIPPLDYLIITHDHWDHLDHATVKQLFPKIKKIITGLGTGAHLEHWGFEAKNIIELDWFGKADLGDGLVVHCEPTRHFSGRTFKRDGTLWASFVLETPKQKIYIGGDSGYDENFKHMGEKYGGIDLAILELGQYNEDWKYIHMLPGEQLQAMKDMKAKRLFPVHNSKFALAAHAWDEPLNKIIELNTDSLRILTPAIGEKMDWTDDEKIYTKWWQAWK